MTTLVAINSPQAMQVRLTQGTIPRFGPVLMLFARSSFILLFQGITFLLLRQLDVGNPAVALRNWWSVYGTLADFGCLGLLIWLTKREGIGLLDLIGFVKSKLKIDILLGLGIFLIVFPATIWVCGRLAMLITYGKVYPEFP